jgi:hypothetical protein
MPCESNGREECLSGLSVGYEKWIKTLNGRSMHNWKVSVNIYCISQSYKTAYEGANWICDSGNSPIAELLWKQ